MSVSSAVKRVAVLAPHRHTEGEPIRGRKQRSAEAWQAGNDLADVVRRYLGTFPYSTIHEDAYKALDNWRDLRNALRDA